MKLHIKYMVSHRCEMRVEDILKRYGIHCISIELGIIETDRNITARKFEEIRLSLFESGLEIITDKKTILIEKIRTIIIALIHYPHEPLKVNFSTYLSLKLKRNYTYLSNLFTESEGSTIERFIIRNKIERIKELITYDELNIAEIAFKLDYSSPAHLSNQFKKETGITPSSFRLQKDKVLMNLESL
ncbi:MULTISPECIES: helix-turn-helix domain-containing protein [unclassified Dysgonomonas]|uniref:helix-turn-helix domain-containing protein n=1 Tax=unclassified Dysgonomonas TaxID=2630389 RepID=UPI0013EE1DA8|nr:MULTISPECIES: AraC family transcriptional regulator [unclassified Dysgonomonas]